MKNTGIIIFAFILIPMHVFSQEERKYIRHGVKDYEENKFDKAEINFRKALDQNNSSYEANYNTGNTLYKQDKPEEAQNKYKSLLDSNIPKDRKADLYYNIGNTLLKTNEYQKSIDAYKNALRIRPDDEDARYNLAWALSKLQEQQNQDQNQNNQDNQEKEQEEKQEKNQQQNQNKDQNNGNQPADTKNLSKEEIERILQALEEKEQEVKEKVEKAKAKARTAPNEKDW